MTHFLVYLCHLLLFEVKMIYADQGLLSAVYPCERCHAFGYDLIILERQPHLLLSLFDRLILST